MVTTDINEVPSLKDEVNRKAFNTIEWLFAAQQRGDIDSRQFNTGVDALFMATSGLVDDEMLTLIQSAGDLADASAPVVERHFFKNGVALSLVWKAGEDVFNATQRSAEGEPTVKSIKEVDSLKAREKLAAMALLLTMKGYVEL